MSVKSTETVLGFKGSLNTYPLLQRVLYEGCSSLLLYLTLPSSQQV